MREGRPRERVSQGGGLRRRDRETVRGRVRVREWERGANDQNKIAWIKWDTVCLPKERGGLGIKDITTFNLALLGKWKWSLFQHQGELWARILESKYGGWRSLNEAPRSNRESIWWRDLKLVSHHPQHGVALQNSTK